MIGSIGSSNALSQWASTLFSKLDTKNQGYIEKSDLESAISGLPSSGTSGSASVDDVFSTLDTDGDGKVTESEMSTSLQNLLSELESQFNSARAGGPGGPGGMGGMPPPPPPPEEGDEGYTQNELTAMAEEIGSSDSKMSSLMSGIAANFDDADTDGNGKVNREEAMAFAQTLESTTSSSATSSGESASASSDTESEEALVLLRIMQLMQAYGAFNADGKTSDSASTLFAAA